VSSAEKSTGFLDGKELDDLVRGFLRQRRIFLRAARRHGSPLYLIDRAVLGERARRFRAAFASEFSDFRIYFAVKSNNHPAVAKTLAEEGLGLDVSSGEELKLALGSGAKDIVFSGPGKTQDELRLALKNRRRVSILIDSFGELDRLELAAARSKSSIRAGVRLTTDERALWAKFGISLSELSDFLARAKKSRRIHLVGLQFHTSWNLKPDTQVEFIERLGRSIQELKEKERSRIEFIDIGGGYWPERGEWFHLRPPGKKVTGKKDSRTFPHGWNPADPIEEFARKIAESFRKNIFPFLSCRVCAEPGRWLVHDAMHILLTVIDRKREDLVITDAGTNAIGWERFETDYFPVINLSRPAPKERPCHILGSLCTPHDVWGYFYHGKEIGPGDILLIPHQGAYTYSLRQEFIKPLPKTVIINTPVF